MATERGAGTLRVFFALWPDAATARALDAHARTLQAACGGRRMARDSLHLTLSFVGEVEAGRVDALAAVAAALRQPAFAFELDCCGAWQGKRIVWMAPSRRVAALHALAASLDASLRLAGFAPERRPFRPHVTLLRKAEAEVPAPDWPPLRWEAKEFCLLASQRSNAGARYQVLGKWRLAA